MPNVPTDPAPDFPVVARFEIRRRRYLDENGALMRPLPDSLAAPESITPLYRAMVLARTLDAKCVALNRQGRLGTYATAYGQEAVPIGVASAMRAGDVLVPSYRENAALVWRGVGIDEVLSYYAGSERGSDWAGPAHDFPTSITVGGHALHAAGAAYALQYRGEARAVACVFGDAATSKGDVYEAFNLAGVWRLPVVFVITNNRWAISTPLAKQTASETLAQKGLAAGIAVEQADGNDVVAVHEAVRIGLDRGRSGGGATLVEALTYRLADHNTADDARRYRDPAEVRAHEHAEPVGRVRRWLESVQAWSDARQAELEAVCSAEVEAGVEKLFGAEPEPPSVIFDHVYAEPSAELARQRDAGLRAIAAEREAKRRG